MLTLMAIAALGSAQAVKVPIDSPSAIASAAVHSVCLKPEQNGVYRSANGSVHAGAQTNQILSKLISAAVDLSAGGDTMSWSGPKQADIGRAIISYDDCAKTIYPLALADAEKARSHVTTKSATSVNPIRKSQVQTTASVAATEPNRQSSEAIAPPASALISGTASACTGNAECTGVRIDQLTISEKPDRHLTDQIKSQITDALPPLSANPTVEISAYNGIGSEERINLGLQIGDWLISQGYSTRGIATFMSMSGGFQGIKIVKAADQENTYRILIGGK